MYSAILCFIVSRTFLAVKFVLFRHLLHFFSRLKNFKLISETSLVQVALQGLSMILAYLGLWTPKTSFTFNSKPGWDEF